MHSRLALKIKEKLRENCLGPNLLGIIERMLCCAYFSLNRETTAEYYSGFQGQTKPTDLSVQKRCLFNDGGDR